MKLRASGDYLSVATIASDQGNMVRTCISASSQHNNLA